MICRIMRPNAMGRYTGHGLARDDDVLFTNHEMKYSVCKNNASDERKIVSMTQIFNFFLLNSENSSATRTCTHCFFEL